MKVKELSVIFYIFTDFYFTDMAFSVLLKHSKNINSKKCNQLTAGKMQTVGGVTEQPKP